MKISEVVVGTELTLVLCNRKYRVTQINGNEISLESVRIVASMDIQLEDLPVIFEDVEK